MLAACAVAFSAVSAQCAAKTEEGAPCKRQAEENSKYCRQHARAKPEAKKPAAK